MEYSTKKPSKYVVEQMVDNIKWYPLAFANQYENAKNTLGLIAKQDSLSSKRMRVRDVEESEVVLEQVWICRKAFDDEVNNITIMQDKNGNLHRLIHEPFSVH